MACFRNGRPGVPARLGPEEQVRGRHAVERDERVARAVETHVEVVWKQADRAAVDEVRRAVAPRAADVYPDVQTLEGRGDGLRRRVAQDERADAALREPRAVFCVVTLISEYCLSTSRLGTE